MPSLLETKRDEKTALTCNACVVRGVRERAWGREQQTPIGKKVEKPVFVFPYWSPVEGCPFQRLLGVTSEDQFIGHSEGSILTWGFTKRDFTILSNNHECNFVFVYKNKVAFRTDLFSLCIRVCVRVCVCV